LNANRAISKVTAVFLITAVLVIGTTVGYVTYFTAAQTGQAGKGSVASSATASNGIEMVTTCIIGLSHLRESCFA